MLESVAPNDGPSGCWPGTVKPRPLSSESPVSSIGLTCRSIASAHYPPGSNQDRQRRLPNGRGSCGSFRPQQRENERWVNYKGKWLSLLELRKVSASPQQNSSSVRALTSSLPAVAKRSLKKP